LPKYQKKKARLLHLFLEANLEKNILTPDNKLFSPKQERKKERKKPSVLTASP